MPSLYFNEVGARILFEVSDEQPLRLGRYALKRVLGAGGWAEVWEGFDEELHRTVAVKVIRDPQPEFVERFRREARMSAALDHPHILPVFDIGMSAGRAYLVMPLVSGGSLSELPEGPAPPDKVVGWIRNIAGALDEAHRHGILHRDIKPANILRDATGKVFLSDFGLAREETAAELTTKGTVLGTPAYMAPEQATGAKLGPTCDQYALGMTAYRLLAGDLPFHGDTPLAVLHQSVYLDPGPASGLNPALPWRVDQVLVRVLAKDPNARFASCAAFADALAEAFGYQASASEPQPAKKPEKKPEPFEAELAWEGVLPPVPSRMETTAPTRKLVSGELPIGRPSSASVPRPVPAPAAPAATSATDTAPPAPPPARAIPIPQPPVPRPAPNPSRTSIPSPVAPPVRPAFATAQPSPRPAPQPPPPSARTAPPPVPKSAQPEPSGLGDSAPLPPPPAASKPKGKTPKEIATEKRLRVATFSAVLVLAILAVVLLRMSHHDDSPPLPEPLPTLPPRADPTPQTAPTAAPTAEAAAPPATSDPATNPTATSAGQDPFAGRMAPTLPPVEVPTSIETRVAPPIPARIRVLVDQKDYIFEYTFATRLTVPFQAPRSIVVRREGDLELIVPKLGVSDLGRYGNRCQNVGTTQVVCRIERRATLFYPNPLTPGDVVVARFGWEGSGTTVTGRVAAR